MDSELSYCRRPLEVRGTDVAQGGVPPTLRSETIPSCLSGVWSSELTRTRSDLCYLGGWKSPLTVMTVYQQADQATMRNALSNRDQRRGVGSR